MSESCPAATVRRTIGQSDYSLSVAPACLDFHAATPFAALPCVTRTNTSTGSSSMPSNTGLRQCVRAAPAPAMVSMGISPGALSPRRSSPCQSPRRSSPHQRVFSSAHAANMACPSFSRNQSTRRTSSLQSPGTARPLSPGPPRSPRLPRPQVATTLSPNSLVVRQGSSRPNSLVTREVSSRPAKVKEKSAFSSQFVASPASPSFPPAALPEKVQQKNTASGQFVSLPPSLAFPPAPGPLKRSASVNLPCCQQGSPRSPGYLEVPPRSPRSPGWTTPVLLSPRLHQGSPVTENGTAASQFVSFSASLGVSPALSPLKKNASGNLPHCQRGSPRSPGCLAGPPRSPRSPGWTTPAQHSPRLHQGSPWPVEKGTAASPFVSLPALLSFSPAPQSEMVVESTTFGQSVSSPPRVTPAVPSTTKKSATVGRVIYPEGGKRTEASSCPEGTATPLFGNLEETIRVAAPCDNGMHELPTNSKDMRQLVVDQENHCLQREKAKKSSSLENSITNQILKVLDDEVRSDLTISLHHPAFFGPPLTQSSYEAQHEHYEYLLDFTSVQDLCGLQEIPVKHALSFFRDAAEDGRLTRERFMETYKLLLQEFYHEPLSLQVTGRVKHAVFSLFDRDANGCVDMMELLCGASLLCKGTDLETVEAFFDLIDLNSDGFITIDEMIQFLTLVSEVAITPDLMSDDVKDRFAAQVVACFLEADADRDGKLSIADFHQWFQKPREEVGLLFSPL